MFYSSVYEQQIASSCCETNCYFLLGYLFLYITRTFLWLVISCSYLHDVIYITSFVQVMSILSDKFWYTYLVVRFIYLNFLYKLCNICLNLNMFVIRLSVWYVAQSSVMETNLYMHKIIL